jgi:AraC-like DNA-binding protein
VRRATPSSGSIRRSNATSPTPAGSRTTPALGYSVRTLTRACRTATGGTAKAYVDGRVLLEAKRLLVHTHAPTSAVAAELGFRDPSDFTKFFRRHDGRTPAAFRAVAQGSRLP